MNEEPLEIGTDKIRKKYQEDTPGETGEIKLAVDYVKKPEIAPTAKQLQKKMDEEFEDFLDVVMIEDEPCCDDCADHFDHVISEAEYQGKTVKLNDPIRTSEVPSKKFKVYVKDGDKVKVVRFGDPNLSIKRDDPDRRKSFRARHNCDNPGPKTKPRYWSCFQWRGGSKVDN